MKTAGLIVVAGIVAALAIGCTHTPVQIYNPKSGTEEAGSISLGKGKRVGKACQHWALYLLPFHNSKLDTALNDLAQQGAIDPGLMTVEQQYVFWLLGFTKCTVVTGYPVIDARGRAKQQKKAAVVKEPQQPKPVEVETPEEDPEPDEPDETTEDQVEYSEPEYSEAEP